MSVSHIGKGKVKTEIIRQMDNGGGYKITEYSSGEVLILVRKPDSMTSQTFDKNTIRISKAFDEFNITVKKVDV